MNIMKSILTLVLVLFFGAIALAQNTNDKVETFKIGVVLVTDNNTSIDQQKTTISTENTVARLYRYKNSRVKSELRFSTLKNRPKLA